MKSEIPKNCHNNMSIAGSMDQFLSLAQSRVHNMHVLFNYHPVLMFGSFLKLCFLYNMNILSFYPITIIRTHTCISDPSLTSGSGNASTQPWNTCFPWPSSLDCTCSIVFVVLTAVCEAASVPSLAY